MWIYYQAGLPQKICRRSRTEREGSLFDADTFAPMQDGTAEGAANAGKKDLGKG